MRLFLGLELPEEIKTHIATSIAPIQSTPKGWENPADYHLTLLFIGEASPAECTDIIHRMQDIPTESFTITLGGLKFFNRRVLYLEILPSPSLTRLKEQIENKFSEWLKPDRKEFIPHITIKRWQRYEYDQLHQGIEHNKIESKTFEVKRLALFKSEKDNQGQKYHVISYKET